MSLYFNNQEVLYIREDIKDEIELLDFDNGFNIKLFRTGDTVKIIKDDLYVIIEKGKSKWVDMLGVVVSFINCIETAEENKI